MTKAFANGPDQRSLGELNARHARVKVRIAASRLAADRQAEASASTELAELDEAIATVLARLALRNADLARRRRNAA